MLTPNSELNYSELLKPMNIVVCLKPAPNPKYWDTMQLDPETKALKRDGIPSVLGPLDKRALEEGLRLRETHGGKVRVMAMAPSLARENLVEALAMGADEAYLLTDRGFAGSDTWATSLALSRGLRKLGQFDLILCGSVSLDGSTGHVGAQLAEFLAIRNVSQVVAVESIGAGKVRSRSLVQSGTRVLESRLPALLTVTREINTPRFTSLFGVIEAESKPLITWSAADLGLAAHEVGFNGSPTQTGDIFLPEMKRQAEMISGEPEELVKIIVDKIRQALG
jgi:electron transfer flavoprotein beta subunit